VAWRRKERERRGNRERKEKKGLGKGGAGVGRREIGGMRGCGQQKVGEFSPIFRRGRGNELDEAERTNDRKNAVGIEEFQLEEIVSGRLT